LDEIAYAPPDFTNRPYDECARRVGQIVELDDWVFEGVHLGWTEPLFERAEVIIWLDHVGWLKSVRRVTRRSAVFAIHEARSRTARDRFLRFDDYARNLRLLLSTLMRSREYWYGQQAPRRYAATRVQVAAALERRAAKVFHVTDSAGRECVRPMVIRERPAFPR